MEKKGRNVGEEEKKKGEREIRDLGCRSFFLIYFTLLQDLLHTCKPHLPSLVIFWNSNSVH